MFNIQTKSFELKVLMDFAKWEVRKFIMNFYKSLAIDKTRSGNVLNRGK